MQRSAIFSSKNSRRERNALCVRTRVVRRLEYNAMAILLFCGGRILRRNSSPIGESLATTGFLIRPASLPTLH
ncbi:MAG: hypothetical protein L6W00_22290 [Lentisphaeria bacterium]|nr:MAG: hypothetical protein L6W00_22290 [Lentisphaeria bacterium]